MAVRQGRVCSFGLAKCPNVVQRGSIQKAIMLVSGADISPVPGLNVKTVGTVAKNQLQGYIGLNSRANAQYSMGTRYIFFPNK